MKETEAQTCKDCRHGDWCLPQQVDWHRAGLPIETFPCILEEKYQVQRLPIGNRRWPRPGKHANKTNL